MGARVGRRVAGNWPYPVEDMENTLRPEPSKAETLASIPLPNLGGGRLASFYGNFSFPVCVAG